MRIWSVISIAGAESIHLGRDATSPVNYDAAGLNRQNLKKYIQYINRICIKLPRCLSSRNDIWRCAYRLTLLGRVVPQGIF